MGLKENMEREIPKIANDMNTKINAISNPIISREDSQFNQISENLRLIKKDINKLANAQPSKIVYYVTLVVVILTFIISALAFFKIN